MTQPTSDQIDLPDYDPDADVQFFPPLHPLAIVTLVIGLLSFLAVFKSTLWVFPIIGIALGVSCLVSLARNPEKGGRRIVLIGLGLAVFFGSWASTRYFARQQWLYGHARRNAEVWLKTVQEKRLREAHQLHLFPDQRAREGVAMEDFYADQEYAQDDYESFVGVAPLAEFIKIAPESTVEFVRFEEYYPHKDGEDVTLRYVARYEENNESKELVMRVIMRRRVNPLSGACGWSVLELLPGDER